MQKQNQLRNLFVAVAAGVMSTMTASAAFDLPAPMPEFMDDAQLETWRNDQIAESNAREAAVRSLDPRPSSLAPFFTGKPLMEEIGEYAFLFRNYNPELARWSSEDPSGFPDGANNLAYMAVPTTEFDWQGLKSAQWLYLWDSLDESRQNLFAGLIESELNTFHQQLESDAFWSSMPWGNPTNYLDDGDTFSFASISNVNELSGLTADKIWVAAHGWSGIGGLTGNWQVIDYSPGASEIMVSRSTNFIKDLNQAIQGVNGCSPQDGNINAPQVVAPWKQPTRDFLYE